jgi:hypothetical protein
MEKGIESMNDFRGIPTCACPDCGSSLLRIVATFNYETYEIDSYLIDNAVCFDCGSLVTAPTPLDVFQP